MAILKEIFRNFYQLMLFGGVAHLLEKKKCLGWGSNLACGELPRVDPYAGGRGKNPRIPAELRPLPGREFFGKMAQKAWDSPEEADGRGVP